MAKKEITKVLGLIVFTFIFAANLFAADIKKTEISAEMDCKNCKNTIEKTLKSTEGIKKVRADLKEQIVKVEFDNDIIKEEKIVKIINDLGYKASVKPTEKKK